MINTLMMFIPQEAYLPLLCCGVANGHWPASDRSWDLGNGPGACSFWDPLSMPYRQLPHGLFAFWCSGLAVSFPSRVSAGEVVGNVISFLLYDLLMAPFRFLDGCWRGFGPGRRV